MRRANSLIAEGALTRAGAARVKAEIAAMDAIFGVLLPGGGEERLSRRRAGAASTSASRRASSASSRGPTPRAARLEALGVVLEDTPAGHALEAASAEPAPLRGPHRGEPGEELACEHLRRKGLRILARNYRCRSGEIDIVVAPDRGTLVFVEVKERRGDSHGLAVEAVTARKRAAWCAPPGIYAATQGLSESAIRFDVVAIDWGPDGPVVRHDENAFSAG